MFSIPAISFDPWVPWRAREKIADAWDIPKTFDYVGLYMLGRFMNVPPPPGPAIRSQVEVVYVGKSHRLVGRTQYHPKTRRYVEHFEDGTLKNLYFAKSDVGLGWRYDDLKYGQSASAKRAYVAYAERWAIWEYARINGRMPLLNMV